MSASRLDELVGALELLALPELAEAPAPLPRPVEQPIASAHAIAVAAMQRPIPCDEVIGVISSELLAVDQLVFVESACA